MIFGNKTNQESLGVDIGTKVIRVVELSRKKDKVILENYGEVNLDIATKDFFRSFDRKNLTPAVDNIAIALRGIVAEAGIKARQVVFSLPDFATFYTTFELPLMPKKELASAVGFEARKYIPLPLSELVLDWQLMNENEPNRKTNQLLVMAIPNTIVEQYKKIAEQSDLELTALEAEAVALKRAVTRRGDPTVCLLEIGFQSTNVSVCDKGYLKTSFSFDIGGKDLTFSLSETLNIPMGEAEEMKRKKGLIVDGEDNIDHILTPVLSVIADKTKKIIKDFELKYGSRVEKLLLAGGTALLPGIVDYFSKAINQGGEELVKVEIVTPFNGIAYPTILEKKILEIGPNFAIALGEALRKFE
jgi:type IV pilus assembly protein PilM